MNALGVTGIEASCGVWWIGGTGIGNVDGFLLSAKGRRSIHLSWDGSILLRGSCMVERKFTETVDTAEEGGTAASKVGGRFCVATGGVNLGGRGGAKSKGGVHRRGGLNNML